jgi:hypothetical protein
MLDKVSNPETNGDKCNFRDVNVNHKINALNTAP